MGRPNFNMAQKPSEQQQQQQQQQQRDVEEGNDSQEEMHQQQQQQQLPPQVISAELHREIVESHRKRIKARLYMLTLLLALAVLTTGYMLSTCIPVFYNIFVEERVDLYARRNNDTKVNEKYTKMETDALHQLFEYRAQLENNLNNEKFLRRIAEKELERLRDQNHILLMRLAMLVKRVSNNDAGDDGLQIRTTTAETNTDDETTAADNANNDQTTMSSTTTTREPSSLDWNDDDLVQES